jgi:hypothetical protein
MIKVLSLFSGYGTDLFALKRLGINFQSVGHSDIDKYANQCFAQNHGGKELGDVRKINPNDLEDFDLLTGGFPCQAFSNAGKMQQAFEKWLLKIFSKIYTGKLTVEWNKTSPVTLSVEDYGIRMCDSEWLGFEAGWKAHKAEVQGK